MPGWKKMMKLYKAGSTDIFKKGESERVHLFLIDTYQRTNLKSLIELIIVFNCLKSLLARTNYNDGLGIIVAADQTF